MNRVTHFEIPSEHPEVSMKFFADVFGWKFEQFCEQQYWLAISGDESTPGINGAIMKPVERNQPVCNTINVQNLDETIQKIEKAGGKIVKPKFAIPSYGWLAFFMDTDGNCHGIVEEDKAAR
ncbi:glyoxalase [Pedobacter lusitanus]|uniref:Glyoxalase n=1 Tax=Pedobacter lusitanus TaxID=1503925 RepID=A0A0D0FSQ6_9SPHI|nr:VOC family protein [Pedobacter lusitanus]KIO75459.1 glyoxalase [Pedobacter lusitanus]